MVNLFSKNATFTLRLTCYNNHVRHNNTHILEYYNQKITLSSIAKQRFSLILHTQ